MNPENAPSRLPDFTSVEEVPHLWIPLADGTRLGARLWRPKDTGAEPMPAILEYLPYRKRDGTADRDALTHPYFAANGYACLRVDMRGCGESEGHMADEYTAQEQQDALEVIEWISQQPWCDGNVGMMGISWGGFNALQVAALQPPALKAIITLCSTDDRYADDIHYKGGCLLLENLGWASTMFAFQSRPGDPDLVGEGWRAQWLERLERLPSFLSLWLNHQHRDDYWRHGSVCEDWSKMTTPTLAIGGWADSYHNPVDRMMRHLPGPKQAIIGPWIHKYPHFAAPQPAMGFLQVATDWWNRWLKDDMGAAADAGSYQQYLMDGLRPAEWYAERPGRWLREDQWPSPRISSQQWHLSEAGLSQTPKGNSTLIIDSPCDTGAAGGEYCPIWLGPEMPGDQRKDDEKSFCFDSEILSEEIAICGLPEVVLNVSSNAPQANLVVRLCEVWPDGASSRISYGVLNLCHRQSHSQPSDLPVDETQWVRVQLDNVAYKVNAGNRLRLAISNHYWPLIWPSPSGTTLTLQTQGCQLALPIHTQWQEDPLPELPPPVSAPARALVELKPGSHQREFSQDPDTGIHRLEIVDDFGRQRDETHALEGHEILRERYSIDPSDPLSARAYCHWTEEVSREGQFHTRTETHTWLRADAMHFFIDYHLLAYEGETPVFEKRWSDEIARQQV